MEPQEISMMNRESEATPFVRVGTTYYKVVPQPQPNGSIAIKRLKWDKQTISFDYGKKYLKTIPHYNGFCTVPVHVGYTTVISLLSRIGVTIGN